MGSFGSNKFAFTRLFVRVVSGTGGLTGQPSPLLSHCLTVTSAPPVCQARTVGL